MNRKTASLKLERCTLSIDGLVLNGRTEHFVSTLAKSYFLAGCTVAGLLRQLNIIPPCDWENTK